MDRVVPAFASAAAAGGALRIDDPSNVLDFTHVRDVVKGLATLACETAAGQSFPPIHFVSGRGVSLGELARLAADMLVRPISKILAPGRMYDVSKFVGNPTRATELLGWTAKVPLEDGFRELVSDFTMLR